MSKLENNLKGEIKAIITAKFFKNTNLSARLALNVTFYLVKLVR
jgi:hypothetical protein